MKVLPKILKAPLIVLVIISFIVSIFNVVVDFTLYMLSATLLLGIVLFSYFLGVFLERKKLNVKENQKMDEIDEDEEEDDESEEIIEEG